MISNTIKLTILCLVLSSCVLARSKKKPVTGMKEYDFYALATEWQGTVCAFKKCNYDQSANDTWNLHGLWPDNDNGKHPFYCTKTNLNFNGLPADLKNLLKLYWSGLYSSQSNFLDHEWTKHGTCWRNDYGNISSMPSKVRNYISISRKNKQNSADFFRTTIALSKDTYSVFNMLKAAGISPSKDQRFTLSSITKAITKGLGGKVTKFKVGCNKDEAGTSWLEDVLICLDKNYKPIDCPAYKPSKCSATGIIYPPIVPKKTISTPIY